jgi:hypothetical protein
MAPLYLATAKTGQKATIPECGQIAGAGPKNRSGVPLAPIKAVYQALKLWNPSARFNLNSFSPA